MKKKYVFKRPKRLIDRVFVHCSASSNPLHDDVNVVRGWHKKLGWNDIGYHFYITSVGELQIGRKLEHSPAAQKGNNVGTIAICLSGLKVDDYTERQFNTLRELCEDINEKIPDVTFHGHTEVSVKECPVFDYKTVLSLDKFGAIQNDLEVDDLETRIGELEVRVSKLELTKE